MKFLLSILLVMAPLACLWAARPVQFTELLPYVQAAPDQGETNTCWFMASTGAMELLLNKKFDFKDPEPGGRYDLAESFLIWQKDFYDRENPSYHFIEQAVKKFNHGEAIQAQYWPFKAFNSDGTDNFTVWNKHPKFFELPRISVPAVKTKLLFARGKKWATGVLTYEDLETMKGALFKHKAPLIVNYNDDGYWHVVLIVGYDDEVKGDCYELKEKDCNNKGSFYVRDSDGKRFVARAYNWFLEKGNAAAVVELK